MMTDLSDLMTLSPAGGFVVLHDYVSTESGEVATHTLNGNVSYEQLVRRSLDAVALVTVEDILSCPSCEGPQMAQEARDAVRTSLQASLDRMTSGEASPSNYEYLVPGVATLPTEPGVLYLWGLAVGKVVSVPGEYRPVKSRPLTLVKAFLTRHLPVSHFRRFKLTDNFSSVVAGGQTLYPRTAAVEVTS